MRDRVQHYIHSLLLDEDLEAVKEGTRGVANGVALHADVLEVLEEGGDLVAWSECARKQTCFVVDPEILLGYEPFFLLADLEEGKLFHLLSLLVVDEHGGPATVDCDYGANHVAALHSLQLMSFPDSERRADGEVAVEHFLAVDGVEGDCELAFRTELVEVGVVLREGVLYHA